MQATTPTQKHDEAPATWRSMQPAFVLDASERHASGLAYAPDGTLYTGGMKGVLRHWDGDKLIEDLVGHTSSVNGIAWCADQMVTVGSDKLVLFWDHGQVTDQWKGYEGMASNGRTLLMRKNTGDKIFLRAPGEAKPQQQVATGIDRSIGGVWSVPGAWAVAGRGPIVQLRDPTNLDVLAELDGHEIAVTSVSATPDGKLLLVSDAGGNLTLWDLPQRKRLATVDTGRTGYVFSAISPDGKRLASAGSGSIHIHDAKGKLLDSDEPGLKGVYGLAWSPDGKQLANAGADGKVRVYQF